MHLACTGRCKAPRHWNSIFSTHLSFVRTDFASWKYISKILLKHAPVAFFVSEIWPFRVDFFARSNSNCNIRFCSSALYWDQLTGLGGCTMKRKHQFVLSKLASLALNEPVLELGDQLNGVRTSWMSLGPVDWVGGMHNEKIVSVCFVKIGHFGTKWASTGIWGPVEWIEDQLNGLGTS